MTKTIRCPECGKTLYCESCYKDKLEKMAEDTFLRLSPTTANVHGLGEGAAHDPEKSGEATPQAHQKARKET